MSVNKNFAIKNGLEVNTKLILADANTNKVGIGSTGPRFELDVAGGIGATDLYVSGISTVIYEFNVGTDGNVLTVLGVGGSVGVGTALPGYLLDVRSPVSTGQTALYVYGDLGVSGDLNIDDINLDQANINRLYVAQNLDITGSGTLNVGGISTFNGYVDINSNTDILGTLNVGGISTFNGYVDINSNTDILGTLNVGGITTITDVTDSTSPNSGSLVVDGGLGVEKSVYIGQNLNVLGNVSVAGTFFTVNTQDVYIANKDIILGFTTNPTPNDDTANHAGVAIASTEGSPLIPFSASGINTLPDTYKQLMWFKSGTLGFSTDMFGFNYGLAIGTTTVSDGIRLAVGSDIRITDDTINTVNLNVNGIVTSTSGIATYYGDGQYLNLKNSSYAGIGIGTTGGTVGYGITFLDFKGAGVSTTQYNSITGIATIFFEGGGGGGSISISTVAPTLPGSGDLWYSPDYGRTFIYYDETAVGYGTDAYWVDAAPFNQGINGILAGVAFSTGSATSPSLYFEGDVQTGFFSPTLGEFTVVSTGSSILNVNSGGIIVTGIATVPSLSVTNDATVGGALTVTGNFTVNGTTTIIDTVNLVIEDKNISIGSTSAATDLTADGGGITIFGSTDKTWTWERDTGCFEYSDPNKFKGVVETVAVGATYDLGGGKVILELDVRNATTYTHSLANGSVGIVSFKNMPADTGVQNGSTITVLFTQNATGTGNTTGDVGVGTDCTVIGYEDGASVVGVTTVALVGSGTTVTLSETANDVDFVSFFIHYNGGTNTDDASYKIYATKNGGFR
jgi:hypothetical protein